MSEMFKIFCKRLLSAHILRNPSLKSFITTIPARKIVPPDQPSLSFTVQYLTNSCGLPQKSAVSASKRFQLDQKFARRYDSVLSFFKFHGFSDADITRLITTRPQILKSSIDKTIKPKMQFLHENGVCGLTLVKIISSQPSILKSSLNNHLKPSFNFLKTLLKTDTKVTLVIRRSSWILVNVQRIVLPIVSLLESQGVPLSNIAKLMEFYPRSLLVKKNRMASVIQAVKGIGLRPGQSLFIHGVQSMIGMSKSTWNSKVEIFKNLGWSEEDFVTAFKHSPMCVACSVQKINKNMDFLVNTMKLEPKAISLYPQVLSYGIDTRIYPRHVVLKILESKKLLKETINLLKVLALPEKIFLKRYVTRNLEKVPDLMCLYQHASKLKED